jgi:hypothetical protein
MFKRNSYVAVQCVLRTTVMCSTLTLSALAIAGDMDIPRHRLNVAVGAMQVDISGTAGAGTVIPGEPGTEYSSLSAPDSVDTKGWQIDYAFNSGASLPKWLDSHGRSSNLSFSASWAGYSGDESARSSVPSAGAATGLLFTRPPNPTGCSWFAFECDDRCGLRAPRSRHAVVAADRRAAG